MNVRAPKRAATHGAPFSAALACAALLSACVLDASGTAHRGQEPSPVAADAEPPAPVAPSSPSDAGELDAAPRDARMASVDAAPVDGARPAQGDGGVDVEAGSPGGDASAASDATSTFDGASGEDANTPSSDGGRDAAPPAIDAATPPGECNVDGQFALQVDYDVSWRGTVLAGVIPLLRAGAGKIRIWALLEMRERGGRARLHGCGTVLPDFASGNPRVGNETYGSYIPSETWERSAMPRFDSRWQLGCHSAGCSVTSDPFVATVGARVNGNSPWPGPNGSLANLILVDHDEDGLPGITLRTRTPNERTASGTPYTEPPLTWTTSVRATRLIMALQIALQLDGALNSCDVIAGTVRAGRVENRVVNCFGRSSNGAGGETPCSPEQARFADENLPEWTVNTGTFRAQRVPTGSTCSDIRAALP